jgi:pimeloyl-ACP methyl ester carboxylesterase
MDLYHSELGEGAEALVLLHGFCENQALWNPIIPEIAGGRRIIWLDLPGFGHSEALSSTTIESVASAVHSFLLSIGAEKTTLLGHSLGGYVALAMAERYPEMVNRLILVNSTALADSEEKKQQRNQTLSFVEKHGAAVFLKTFAPSLFSEKQRKEKPEHVQMLLDITSGTSKAAILAYTVAMRDRKDRTDVLKAVPALFIAGAEDALVGRANIEKHREWIAEEYFHVLDDCGHVAMLEQPKMLVEKVKAFLNATDKL